ncbi:phosphatase PAP2 family protein [Neorhizobium alkalisoli]|uniref:PAP2 superfamily protein n=1 Tax=Neorhizobium alkalisoli TaxID=528178 RepID=A0A561R2G5_9HYPH|nr:phosphatase PAP2 family protein [Neorhizobium alkalisoli]TWF56802.1 PAP2 superfamily protein [Neorhizobium alkalisoli]
MPQTLLLPFPLQQSARRHFFAGATGWLAVLATAWCLLLALFHAFPQIDIMVAEAFFRETACNGANAKAVICGFFPYSKDPGLILVRKILFYLPGACGLYLLYRLLDNFQHHGATYCWRKARDYSIALTALLIGPYLLVNLVIKQISNRPRPYDTDLFGGSSAFTAAGDFAGACMRNCSFISGEAAGTGWMACLIVLLPKHLRLTFGPPLIAISLVSPALRLAFGGHYLSDVMLGWLSAPVVYAAVALRYEMSQRGRKQCPPTIL